LRLLLLLGSLHAVHMQMKEAETAMSRELASVYMHIRHDVSGMNTVSVTVSD
jgi:hypothetical protein